MSDKRTKTDESKRLYRAPALEKGLDILEMLATEEEPLTVSAIVQRLGRSTGELFRMIQVLEHRGFVAQGRDGYTLTNRLFEISLGRPPLRNLVEIALPLMRRLVVAAGQSCHLAVRSGANMVVIARMEAREQLGFSVRIGYHQPLHLTNSGLILYAFQPDDARKQWEAAFDPPPSRTALAAFRRRAEAARRDRFSQQESNFASGITDLSAPVLRGGHAAAALSVPFFHAKGRQMPVDQVAALLRDAATAISGEMVLNDNRI